MMKDRKDGPLLSMHSKKSSQKKEIKTEEDDKIGVKVLTSLQDDRLFYGEEVDESLLKRLQKHVANPNINKHG
jgi:hypothetical protein